MTSYAATWQIDRHPYTGGDGGRFRASSEVAHAAGHVCMDGAAALGVGDGDGRAAGDGGNGATGGVWRVGRDDGRASEADRDGKDRPGQGDGDEDGESGEADRDGKAHADGPHRDAYRGDAGRDGGRLHGSIRAAGGTGHLGGEGLDDLRELRAGAGWTAARLRDEGEQVRRLVMDRRGGAHGVRAAGAAGCEGAG